MRIPTASCASCRKLLRLGNGPSDPVISTIIGCDDSNRIRSTCARMLSATVSVRMMTAQSRCAATASSASAALGAQATVCPDTPARRNPRTVSSSAMLNYFTAQPRFFAATSWRRRNQARPVLPLGIIRMKYLGREAKERMLDMPYGKKGRSLLFCSNGRLSNSRKSPSCSRGQHSKIFDLYRLLDVCPRRKGNNHPHQ